MATDAGPNPCLSTLVQTYIHHYNTKNIKGITNCLAPEVKCYVRGTLKNNTASQLLRSYAKDFSKRKYQIQLQHIQELVRDHARTDRPKGSESISVILVDKDQQCTISVTYWYRMQPDGAWKQVRQDVSEILIHDSAADGHEDIFEDVCSRFSRNGGSGLRGF